VKIETRRVELHGDHAERHPEARPGAYAVLAVSDTGAGMDAATQGRMFEPFFTTKPQGRGTGLGLAMAYGTVKQSGGHITCRSEVGVGTTFEVYLPLVDEQVSPAADGPPARPPAAGRETVLLIEDEASLRDLLVETLEGAGYAVLVAPGGEDALRMVQEHPGVIHLVVTDVMMPGLTGRQVAERIRAARPEVRVLFVSGYVGDALARHGVSEPEARLLSKPFTAEALLRKVREVLDGP
jgi:CheY-like chemotaxis protein